MDAHFASQLLQAVRAQHFETTADRWQGGAPVASMPSLDLAVVVFRSGSAALRTPRAANVLFSREHPQGHVAHAAGGWGALDNLHFVADLRDAAGESLAWAPGADWSRLPFAPLAAGPAQGPRFVAPYPASLIKLVVAVGVALAVDAGRCTWPDALEPMIGLSDNDATDTCVALLHATGMVDTLNHTLQRHWGLPTLQLNRTTPAGGWRNAQGAGVGALHMTAWDTVRLLWLLDTNAPPAPWLAADAPRLSRAACEHLRSVLARQQLDEILSSGRLRGVPGWVPGLPDAPAFAHKTGTTDNYASDAGIVHTADAHYAVALFTSLGRRYAAPDADGHDRCATSWRVPALGAELHRLACGLKEAKA